MHTAQLLMSATAPMPLTRLIATCASRVDFSLSQRRWANDCTVKVEGPNLHDGQWHSVMVTYDGKGNDIG